MCGVVHVCTNSMSQCIWRPGINNRHLPGPHPTLYFEAESLEDGLVIMAGGLQGATRNLVVVSVSLPYDHDQIS